MNILVFAVTTIVLSVIMVASSVVFGQTATPTTTISPTTTTTNTPTPTGQTQSGTVPSGAPATGMGGN